LTVSVCNYYYETVKGPEINPKVPKVQGVGAYFRPRDLKSQGIPFARLQRMVRDGEVERLKHGLYRMTEMEPNEFETIAMVCSAVPKGLVCLLSALRYHEIGTQAPPEVWIALNRVARRPAHLPARVRIVRFSELMMSYGVQSTRILGVPVRITSPARTVVDCFRYRSKIGVDVAIEALRDVVRSRKAGVDEIVRAAETCHARTILRVYLEALET
jgi:predicted transcriptional regulator of viral defense system